MWTPESSEAGAAGSNRTVRLLRESDLPEADRIFRLAFGTFLGLPDPVRDFPDSEFIRGRWLADPSAAFGAQEDGVLVGSNFATRWGSFGFFGPLTVHPDRWDRGVGSRLMDPVMECFHRWGTQHAGLFTFPHSPRHVGLYQKFGFWPRCLTFLMAKPVEGEGQENGWSLFSAAREAGEEALLAECNALTDAIYSGLSVEREIRAVREQELGDTVLIGDGQGLVGLAVCHCGAGTEGGSGVCYIKFAAVRSGQGAEGRFERLLAACEALAGERGLQRLVAGCNSAREEACRWMLAGGFRVMLQGIAMHRPNESGHNRPGVWAIDDWR